MIYAAFWLIFQPDGSRANPGCFAGNLYLCTNTFNSNMQLIKEVLFDYAKYYIKKNNQIGI
jgi:hypothetical protein